MPQSDENHKFYRSLFWPVVLLGAGVIWLLNNLNIIPTENLWLLLQLWPVLFIIAGLDMLFARRLPLFGAILGLFVIAGVVLILLYGGALPFEDRSTSQTETFILEEGNTTSVVLDLNLSTQKTIVSALTESQNLLEAEIGHFGDIDFSVTGAEEKQVRLEQTGFTHWFNWLLPEARDETLVWDIGLSPVIPFDLDVDASTGTSEMDLTGLQLAGLRFNASTGASTIVLPQSSDGYQAQLEASTGSMTVVFPENSNLTVRLDGSTGRILLDVPQNTAVQVDVLSGGTGDLQTPDWITKTTGNPDRDEGIYQSADYDAAAYQLIIIVEDIGTGHIVLE